MSSKNGFSFFGKSNFARQRGFTLIEILVVISIIAILSAFVAASVTQILKNSRDQKRKGDLNSIASLLQRFYNDNGHYPLSSSGQIQYNSTDCSNSSPDKTVTWGTDGIVCNGKTYLKNVPNDPFGSPRQSYCYSQTGSTYFLAAVLENTSDKEREAANFSCGGSLAIYNYKYFPNK